MTVIETDVIKTCILDSARDAFEKMIFLPLGATDQPLPESSRTLIGTITFAGQIQGAFSLLCRVEGAEKIARAMLMSEPEDAISLAEIGDAFGEVTNLVLGGIKSRLADRTPDMQISIPIVTLGRHISPVVQKEATCTEVTAQSDDEPIQMTLIYKMK